MSDTAVKTKSNGTKGKRVASNNKSTALVMLAAVALVLVAATAGTAWYILDVYDKIYPNVYVGETNIGTMTEAEAAELLRDRLAADNDMVMTVSVSGTEYTLEASEVYGGSADAETLARSAMETGREGSFFNRIGTVIRLYSGRKMLVAEAPIDENRIAAFVNDIALEVITIGRDSMYEVGDQKIHINEGSVAQILDRDAAVEALTSRFYERDFTPFSFDAFLQTEDFSKTDLQTIYDAIYVEPVNAYYEYIDGEVVVREGVVGVSFDLAAAQEALSTGKTDFDIPLIYTPPEVTETYLSECLFRDVLSEVKTPLDPSQFNRTSNVKLAVQFINSKILMPGDEFSYNGTVGERTGKRGFKDAAVYLSSGIEEQLGGGICQVSSTLYMAAIRTQLEIVERANHRYTVVYSPLGEDATVYWGSRDFRFKNNLDFPIKIEAVQSGSYCTVRILGTKQHENTVKITSEVLNSTEFTTVEEADPTLPVGRTSVKVYGHNGYKVRTYCSVYDKDGNLIEKYELGRSTYYKLDKVVLVGTLATPEPSPTVTPVPTDTPPPSPSPSEVPETSSEPSTDDTSEPGSDLPPADN